MKEKTSWNLDKENSTPFDNTLHRFDTIVGEQCRENKTWRLIALISMTAFFLSLFIMIWTVIKDSKEKRYVPILISMNDIGEPKYQGEIKNINYSTLKVPQEAIIFQLRDFVEKAYTIPKDSTVLKENLKKCYAILTSSAGNKFTNEIKKDNPLEKYGSVMRSVEIESIVEVSNKSYQIDYFVKETTMDNLQLLNHSKYRSVITIDITEPTEEDKIKNPLGIYIVDFGTTLLKK